MAILNHLGTDLENSDELLDHFGDHFLIMKVMNLLGINPNRVDFNHFWVILVINFLIMKSGESARYQPQQGGFQSFLDHFGDHFFDRGWISIIFGSFWGSTF